MSRGGGKSKGLAARIVRVTLAIGTVTVLAAISVAVVGTSRLASTQIAGRDATVLQSIEDEALSRFSAAERLVVRAGRAASSARTPASLTVDINPAFETSADIAEALTVFDRSGAVLASFPTSRAAEIDQTAFRAALRGETGFTRAEAEDNTWHLWLTRAVITPSGTQAIVVARINTDFVLPLVRKTATESGRSIFVMENGGILASAGAVAPADLGRAHWLTQGVGKGTTEVPRTAIGKAVGHYNDIEGINGIAWRLVALEPAGAAATDTMITVTPSIIVLLIGGVFALVAAWLIATRLVEPLRALEEAAYRAAAGAYVKPLTEDRDDEVGQVAHAFNAVALRLNALHDLSQLLASASQLDQVLDGILSAMGHIVGPGVAAIYLLDESGRWLVPVSARGVDASQASSVDCGRQGWLADSLSDTDPVVRSGESARLSEELPGLVDGETAVLVAPLVAGNEVLGVVVVLRDAADDVSEAEKEMVRTFSAQAAVAVQNSRLFAVETESRRVAEGLRAMAEALVRHGGLDEALRESERLVADLLGASSASFAVIDRAALGLPPATDRAQEAETLAFALRILSRSGTKRPVVVKPGDDPAADALMARTESGELIVVPVALESQHGAVLIASLTSATAGRRDIELAQAVGNELALAFDNAYLYGRAVSRANNLETVFRISQTVGSSLQINVVLNRVLDVVQKILSADAVALMSFDSRRRLISTTMARGAVSPDLMVRTFAPGDDVPGYVFTTGEPAALHDLHEGMGGIAGDAAAHDLHSLLAVPLLARGRSIGVLTVFSAQAGAFSDEDMSMLQTFASQAALAIDTARLYGQEHEVATILQQSILPDALPEFPELEAGSIYRPAGGQAEIGGDYYDLFRAPDRCLWLVIADVCGKGVVAATKTSMIKYAVRSFVVAGYDPSAVLSEVNNMVVDAGETSDIVTLWAGRYEPDSARLTWASGGHPPGFMRRASDGLVMRLESTGPLLGAISGVRYAQETLPLNTGDTVLLYTDGVTEARSGNMFFGEDRIGELLALGGTPVELAETLLDSVKRFVRGELRDDVAVLVVTVKPAQEDKE